MKRLFSIYLLILSYSLLAGGVSDSNKEELMYNEALKAYYEKDYIEVEKLFTDKPVGDSDSLNLMKLNLAANNFYRLSDYYLDKDSDKAFEAVEKSIGFYKRVLQVDKNDADVSHNLEMAMLKREEIQSGKEETQKQQDQSESNQNQLDNLQKEQENLSSDPRKGEEEHKSSQEKIKNETEEFKNRMSPSEQELKDKLERAQSAQEKALDAMDKKNFNEAGEYQKEASQYLKEASEILDGKADEQRESDEQDDSVNESDQIAKSIIDNENDRESTSEATGDGIFVDRNW